MSVYFSTNKQEKFVKNGREIYHNVDDMEWDGDDLDVYIKRNDEEKAMTFSKEDIMDILGQPPVKTDLFSRLSRQLKQASRRNKKSIKKVPKIRRLKLLPEPDSEIDTDKKSTTKSKSKSKSNSKTKKNGKGSQRSDKRNTMKLVRFKDQKKRRTKKIKREATPFHPDNSDIIFV